jgi:hypothetical protein
MVYDVGSSLSITFDDLKIYYDDIEYLRRAYRNMTLDGRTEIQDRISLVSSTISQ